MLRSTLPTTRKQRTPQVPDQRTVRNRDLYKKILQKENFDHRHGARTLPSVHPGARVWIPAKQTKATVSAEVAPRSLQVKFDEGVELRRNRRDVIPLPDQPEGEPNRAEGERLEQEPEKTLPTNPALPTKSPVLRQSTRIKVPPSRFAPYIEH